MFGITSSKVHLNNLGFANHEGEEALTEENISRFISTDRYRYEMFEPFRDQFNHLPYLDPPEGVDEESNDPHVADTNEIDWYVIKNFHTDNTIAFAGRYFLGHATDEEIDNDTGFALWAHGESSYEGLPNVIFPIQRANPRWQQTTGETAKQLAAIDANAMIDAITNCLVVGDLSLNENSHIIYVYLEAAKGKLTRDYWQAWSNTIHAALRTEELLNHAIVDMPSLPFVPCIICDFEQYPETEEYWPEATIREALNVTLEPSSSIFSAANGKCYSIWAVKDRSFSVTSPAPVFKTLYQGSSTIPIDIRRTDELSSPELKSLSLVTFDYIEGEPSDTEPYPHPLDKALVSVKDWCITAPLPTVDDPQSDYSLLPTWPSQTGIDNAQRIDNSNGDTAKNNATAIRNTEIFIQSLPISSRGTDLIDTDGTYLLSANTAFVGRYLESGVLGTSTPPRVNEILAGEVAALSGAGLSIVSIYQHVFSTTDIENSAEFQEFVTLANTNPRSDEQTRRMAELEQILATRVNSKKSPAGKGYSHGEVAFNYANSINQAPYTPIYFAIDLSVNENSAGNPRLDEIIKYFRDIRKAYKDYRAQENSIPYYVGVYNTAKVFNALYRAGLASHFWQAAPTGWGPPSPTPNHWNSTSTGWRAWPHANLWQIALDNNGSTWTKNKPLKDIYSAGQTHSWTDINVAWGNPGGWTQWRNTMPHVPILTEEE